MKYTYKKDGYKPDNEIFVFGSNLAGIHGAGAAQEAFRNYGAEWQCPIGHFGQSYAIPTKDTYIRTMCLSDVKKYIDRFILYAETNPHLKFYVTRIGCGLAGFTDDQIAPFFVNAPVNCSFAEDWKEYLENPLAQCYNE